MDFIKYFKHLGDKHGQQDKSKPAKDADGAVSPPAIPGTPATETPDVDQPIDSPLQPIDAPQTDIDAPLTPADAPPPRTDIDAPVSHANYDATFLTTKVKQVANMLATYRTVPAPDQQQTLTNLRTIKQAIEQPKEAKPDLRAAIIEANLGEAECHQTVREERWHDTVHCPYCFATDIERMPPSTQYSPYNFRYLCLACHSRFNDDSRTPFEAKIPSLETWIQCWFLLGCTNSFDYIAAKLNLDLEQVKLMITELRRVFNANQPLTQLMSYERWHKAHAEKISARIKHEIILTKQELFAGDTTEQPKDTAIVRRQKERRQSPKGTPPKF